MNMVSYSCCTTDPFKVHTYSKICIFKAYYLIYQLTKTLKVHRKHREHGNYLNSRPSYSKKLKPELTIKTLDYNYV